MRSHISFSELKVWNECPYKHKLVYKDNIKEFLGNEYTAFGTAIHEVCEKSVLGEIDRNFSTLNKCFNNKFLEEIKTLTEKDVELNKKLVEDMKLQGVKIIPHIMPALNKYFKDHLKEVDDKHKLDL